MQKNGQIEQKSQELAFALIRIAAYIRKSELKNRIDALSFNFVQWIAEERFDEALSSLNAVKNLVELGKHLLQIEPINAKILLKEVESLNQTIRQSIYPEIILEEAIQASPAKVSKIDTEVANIRQDKILDLIRQSGKSQLKELIAEFPGISERTLRYDLKKLSDEGKVLRQGTGGPSNYYVLNTSSYPQV